jgi:hypothetical protein
LLSLLLLMVGVCTVLTGIAFQVPFTHCAFPLRRPNSLSRLVTGVCNQQAFYLKRQMNREKKPRPFWGITDLSEHEIQLKSCK